MDGIHVHTIKNFINYKAYERPISLLYELHFDDLQYNWKECVTNDIICKYINFGIFLQNIYHHFLEHQESGLLHSEEFHDFYFFRMENSKMMWWMVHVEHVGGKRTA
jgi:hypothetical protein